MECKKNVLSRIKSGRHGALDKATGAPKQIVEIKHGAVQNCFCSFSGSLKLISLQTILSLEYFRYFSYFVYSLKG